MTSQGINHHIDHLWYCVKFPYQAFLPINPSSINSGLPHPSQHLFPAYSHLKCLSKTPKEKGFLWERLYAVSFLHYHSSKEMYVGSLVTIIIQRSTLGYVKINISTILNYMTATLKDFAVSHHCKIPK